MNRTEAQANISCRTEKVLNLCEYSVSDFRECHSESTGINKILLINKINFDISDPAGINQISQRNSIAD